jgi:bifunctional ADP-heptose synthase (sugar kinase/adenylyltransferase)
MNEMKILVVDVESEEYRLGGCLNVAANLRSMSPYYAGHRLCHVSLSSFISSFMRRKIESKDIDTKFSFCFPGKTNGPSEHELVKTRVVNLYDEAQLIRIDNKKKVEPEIVTFYDMCLKEVSLDYFDAVVISDYNKGLINEKIVSRVSRFEKTVFIDTKKDDLSFWESIPNKIIKINQDEFDKCTNKKSAGCLIVTQGSEGCSYYSDGELKRHIPTDKCNLNKPDVVGAGDVFLAGLVIQYLDTEGDLIQALEFANKAATRSVYKNGTCEVTYDEVKSEG